MLKFSKRPAKVGGGNLGNPLEGIETMARFAIITASGTVISPTVGALSYLYTGSSETAQKNFSITAIVFALLAWGLAFHETYEVSFEIPKLKAKL